MIYKNIRFAVAGLIVLVCVVFFCRFVSAQEVATDQLVDRYVKTHDKNLPLVLGIPGFRVPGVTIPQEKHFGDLSEILKEKGIPYYCISYDTDEYPLPKVADLSSETYSIASTRVIPSIVRVIKLEEERRAKEGLPPVRDVVMFMYSQGTVVSYGFVRALHYFRRRYQLFHEKFGIEQIAIKNDPVFTAFIHANDNFTLIKNIQVQREKDFHRDPDLRLFYDRALEEVNRRYEDLENYLIDPKSIYPYVKDFDPPETDKYPKRYIKIKAFAEVCRLDPEKRKNFKNFIQKYSVFQKIKDINFMYFSASGSIFGSPHANSGYSLLKRFPIGRFFVKGMNQIKDTRLGSFHHTQKIKDLVRESKLANYPINKKNTLFIVGANDEQGDDLVDQPSAHISGHGYVDLDLDKTKVEKNVPIKVKMEVLPEQNAIPLKLHHFPVKTFFGLGPTLPGSAYMTKNHVVLDYLFPFIYKDFDRIDVLKKANPIFFRQFMIEFTFSHIKGDAKTSDQIAERRRKLLSPGGILNKFIKELDVKIIKKPKIIAIQDKIFNAENLTYVFVGTYKESFLYPGKPATLSMDFDIKARGYDPVLLTLPVKAGKILFVNINLRKQDKK